MPHLSIQYPFQFNSRVWLSKIAPVYPWVMDVFFPFHFGMITPLHHSAGIHPTVKHTLIASPATWSSLVSLLSHSTDSSSTQPSLLLSSLPLYPPLLLLSLPTPPALSLHNVICFCLQCQCPIASLRCWYLTVHKRECRVLVANNVQLFGMEKPSINYRFARSRLLFCIVYLWNRRTRKGVYIGRIHCHRLR